MLALVLLVLLLWLQYKLWLQDGGIPEVLQLQADVSALNKQVETLQERNRSLEAEVRDLKQGLEAVEERARSDLGMIRKGEVYYQVIEPAPETGKDTARVPGRARGQSQAAATGGKPGCSRLPAAKNCRKEKPDAR